MRVDVDLPDDLYEIVAAMARTQSRTVSEVVVGLIRRGLAAGANVRPNPNPNPNPQA